MKLRGVLPALLAVSLVSAASAQASLQALEGKPIPAFSLVDTKGAKLTDKVLKGKVVLLDFWATWCGPCKEASPTMQKFHTNYAKSGLKVIGVNTSEFDDAAGAAAKYAKAHNYTYSMTPKSDAFAAKLGVRGLPTFILVDKKGKVRKVWIGYDPKGSPSEMEALVKKLLAEK